jgi:hypothetical protein
MKKLLNILFIVFVFCGMSSVHAMDLEDDERLLSTNYSVDETIYSDDESIKEVLINNDLDDANITDSDDESSEHITNINSFDERMLMTEAHVEQAHSEDTNVSGNSGSDTSAQVAESISEKITNHNATLEDEDSTHIQNVLNDLHNMSRDLSQPDDIQEPNQQQPANPTQSQSVNSAQESIAQPSTGNYFSNHKVATVLGITAMGALAYYVYIKWTKSKEDKKKKETQENKVQNRRRRRA